MKGSLVILCLAVCLLLIFPPVASAMVTPVPTCPNRVNDWTNITYTPTYGPPGPDGTIYVESSPPGAVISVNGENKGHAPVTITGLWPGSYTVTADLAGYQKFTSVTTISGATRASIYCSLAPDNTGTGLYVMSTPASANVYLDGVQKGKTPLMFRDITNGSHSIRMILSGYADWEETVEAPTGGIKTVSAILKETGTDMHQGLSISSNPGGAKIILDGLEKGVTPKILNTIAPGIHILEIEYTGYNSWKSTIDVPETNIKVISINLTPNPANAPGWISVFSNPANASVTLDGNYVGRTSAGSSLNLDTRPPGDYTLVLALPGYKPYTTRVTVSPSNVTTVNATLIPVSGPFAKGALSVTTDPAGATIFVDNESVGVSPFTADDITAGNHQITIRMKGYQDYSTSILVTAGATRTVSATLLRGNSSLYSPVFPLTALAALFVVGFFVLRKYQ